MGRVSNAFLKSVVKLDNTYTEEQKEILCSAIDKHGLRGLSWATGAGNGNYNDSYQFSADEMKEVLKFAESVDAVSFAYARALPNIKLKYIAKAYNDLYARDSRDGSGKLYEEWKSESKYKLAPTAESLFKSFFKIVSSIDYVPGRDSDTQISNDLTIIKEKIIDPFIEHGHFAQFRNGFKNEQLRVLEDACSTKVTKVNIMRLLDNRYSPDQMKLITNAMLERVDDNTLDKLCDSQLSVGDMIAIMNPHPDISEGTIVIDETGRIGKVTDCENSMCYVHYEDGTGLWQDYKDLNVYERGLESREEKPSLDSLIETAHSISESTRELYQGLQKHKESQGLDLGEI